MSFAPICSHRRVLCLFPRHTNGFASFSYAFRFFPDTVALMPPQGILTIAAYLPASWEVRFIDENVRRASDADFAWADIVLASGMHTQRKRLLRVIAKSGSPNQLFPCADCIHHLRQIGSQRYHPVGWVGQSNGIANSINQLNSGGDLASFRLALLGCATAYSKPNCKKKNQVKYRRKGAVLNRA